MTDQKIHIENFQSVNAFEFNSQKGILSFQILVPDTSVKTKQYHLEL